MKTFFPLKIWFIRCCSAFVHEFIVNRGIGYKWRDFPITRRPFWLKIKLNFAKRWSKCWTMDRTFKENAKLMISSVTSKIEKKKPYLTPMQMQTQYQRYKSTHRIHFVDRQQANVKTYCHHRLNGCKMGRKTQEQGRHKNKEKPNKISSSVGMFRAAFGCSKCIQTNTSTNANGINKTYSVVCLFVHLKMTVMLFMLSKIILMKVSYKKLWIARAKSFFRSARRNMLNVHT